MGGFSKSPLLRQKNQQVFSDRISNIVMPAHPGYLVVEGAVHFGLNPGSIRTRCSRLTYGTSVTAAFDEAHDLVERKCYSLADDSWQVHGRFKPFVLAGDPVEKNQTSTHYFVPTTNSQSHVAFPIYSTANRQVRYIDEPGVKKIGEMQLKLSPGEKRKSRVVKVTVYLGRTEIRIEARDAKADEMCESNFYFSTVC